MNHFLYVFSEKERDTLLALNYRLLKSDNQKNIYVFENQENLRFDLNEVHAFESDILTF